MRQPSPRRVYTWRLTSPRPPAAATPDPVVTRMTPPPPDRGASAVPAELKAETAGPDGVRHGLVAHVRQLIADGAYDTPERWEAAQERLFQSLRAGR
jgi:hypothetical protein